MRIAARQWSAGFLPSRFQGVHLRSKGDAVLYLGNPSGYSRDMQADVVETINKLTHTQRRHAHHHTSGTGQLCQEGSCG